MPKRILVINPNSSEAVTEGIDRALDALRGDPGIEIRCLTMADGPPGIETQRDVERVTLPICRLVAQKEAETDAFVIACFSDPGLFAAREATTRPVFGISAAGVATALNLGDGVGILAILPASVARHRRYFRAIGMDGRIAGERPIGLGIAELADEKRSLQRMTEVGRALRDEDGADVLVMGCAGMARLREPLESALGLPVVDPTQAAVGLAITAVRLGLVTR